MSVRIEKAGLLTTVQDLGRSGHQDGGFSVSGAMDRRAAVTANRLVGNGDGAAVLEMTLYGVTLTALDRTLACLSGGDFDADLNGRAVAKDRSFALLPGDVLRIGRCYAGCRGYLAFRGGIDVPPAMGSRSTNLKCRIGGLSGRKLAPGDILPVFPAPWGERDEGRAFTPPRYFGDSVCLRAVPGPQAGRFRGEPERVFFSSEYKVLPQSDRMGVRLSGAKLEAAGGSDIVSDGIVPGCVQVPRDGQPIVLAADCQTTGGYAKIAAVITADLPKLGQLRPGSAVRFEPVSAEEAQAILRADSRNYPRKAGGGIG